MESVDPARSFGITDADNVRISIYETDCYLGPNPKGIQVSVDYTVGGGFGINDVPLALAGLGSGSYCPPGTKFYVVGVKAQDGSRRPVAYFLSLVL